MAICILYEEKSLKLFNEETAVVICNIVLLRSFTVLLRLGYQVVYHA